MTLTTLKIGAAAPDFTLPDHIIKSWCLAEGFQSQNVLLVCNIGVA